MMFQMFSIASVMMFGAIVVNLYQQTTDAILSRSSRRKLIRTLGPFTRVGVPEHMLQEVREEKKKKTESNEAQGRQDAFSSLNGHGFNYDTKSSQQDTKGYHGDTVSNYDNRTEIEWQTIAHIMDRVFLILWAITNTAGLVTILIVL